MLAASFSSVLVYPLGGLPYFVDLWGESEGGKSVATMVAASIWANPDESAYIKDYKGTEVGLEAICDLLNNLPLILDDSSKRTGRLKITLRAWCMTCAPEKERPVPTRSWG